MTTRGAAFWRHSRRALVAIGSAGAVLVPFAVNAQPAHANNNGNAGGTPQALANTTLYDQVRRAGRPSTITYARFGLPMQAACAGVPGQAPIDALCKFGADLAGAHGIDRSAIDTVLTLGDQYFLAHPELAGKPVQVVSGGGQAGTQGANTAGAAVTQGGATAESAVSADDGVQGAATADPFNADQTGGQTGGQTGTGVGAGGGALSLLDPNLLSELAGGCDQHGANLTRAGLASFEFNACTYEQNMIKLARNTQGAPQIALAGLAGGGRGANSVQGGSTQGATTAGGATADAGVATDATGQPFYGGATPGVTGTAQAMANPLAFTDAATGIIQNYYEFPAADALVSLLSNSPGAKNFAREAAKPCSISGGNTTLVSQAGGATTQGATTAGGATFDDTAGGPTGGTTIAGVPTVGETGAPVPTVTLPTQPPAPDLTPAVPAGTVTSPATGGAGPVQSNLGTVNCANVLSQVNGRNHVNRNRGVVDRNGVVVDRNRNGQNCRQGN